MARKPSKVIVEKNTSSLSGGYLDKISKEVQASQSKLSMILGGLIILVTVILLFNFFNRNKASLGPAQQTETSQTEQQSSDVQTDQLPGKYTVKENDTLFLIAEKYYQDGYKFDTLAKANNITDPNNIEVGQVLKIPSRFEKEASNSSQISQAVISEIPAVQNTQKIEENNDMGAKITGEKYTVQEGDWLSTISGRAYGDIMAYEKIAKANNITDPNLIEAGTVLVIPR